MKRRVGFLTIGQSPREDILAEMRPFLGEGLEILQRGALDGIPSSRLEILLPEQNDFPLISRLRDGKTVIVGKKKITPLLQEELNNLEDSGVELTALLCTEDFKSLTSSRVLIQPFQLLIQGLRSFGTKGCLAVFVPLGSQAELARKKWTGTGFSIEALALNPYQAHREWTVVGAAIGNIHPDLALLDCIGYTVAAKESLRKALGKPVLLPRTLLASFVREIV